MDPKDTLNMEPVYMDDIGRSLFRPVFYVVWDQDMRGEWELPDLYRLEDGRAYHNDFMQGREITPKRFNQFGKSLDTNIRLMSKEEALNLAQRNGKVFFQDTNKYVIANRYNPVIWMDYRGEGIEAIWEFIKITKLHTAKDSLLFGRGREGIVGPSFSIVSGAILIAPILVVIMIVLITTLFARGQLRRKFRRLLRDLENRPAEPAASEATLSDEKQLEKIFDNKLGAMSHRTPARRYLKDIIKQKKLSPTDPQHPEQKAEIEDLVGKFEQFFNFLIRFQQDSREGKLGRMRSGDLRVTKGMWVLDDEEIDNLFTLYDPQDASHPFNTEEFTVLAFSGYLEIEDSVVLEQVAENLAHKIKDYLDQQRRKGKLVSLPDYPLKGRPLSLIKVAILIFLGLVAYMLGILPPWLFVPWVGLSILLKFNNIFTGGLMNLHFIQIPKALITIYRTRKYFDPERADKEKLELAFKSYFWKRIIRQWIIYNILFVAFTVFYAWDIMPLSIFIYHWS
jgi:hypothetical protein